MKKILAIMLAVLMVFAVCSCGKKEETQTNDDVNETVVDNNDAQPADDGEDAQPADDGDDAGETDEESGTLVMATNAFFKPYEYYEGEEIVGIDAEIAAEIAKKLGKELVIEDMEFSSIITAVQEGSVDFGMAGMTVTDERKESVNFSSSYANGVQSIIVKEDSPITTVDDLFGDAVYKIGVQLGTTGDIYSTDDFGAENVIQYSKGNEAVLALVGGSIDCVIIDNEPAKALVAENEGLKILETSYADEDYAICVAKENTELLDQINVAIDELTAEGVIDAIVAKYIK
jgi:polar amino acid transport system substrate-binding protein